MKKIVQVTYTSSSGSILPELQWTERVSLSYAGSSITRTAKIDTSEVNAGTWNLPIDELSLKPLFSSLQELNCKKLERVEPQDTPDGGGTESFIFSYRIGTICEMTYDTGVSYGNGDLYSGLIREFVKNLSLPMGAANRYKMPTH